jgi:hypothetical protein
MVKSYTTVEEVDGKYYLNIKVPVLDIFEYGLYL